MRDLVIPIIPINLRVGCILLASALTLAAHEDGKKPEPVPSIQQQLDGLKEGQERLFKELEQIKTLLEAKQDKVTFGPTPAPPTNLITLNVHGEPFRGAPAAKVGIIEYSDFGCSYCAKYVREVFPRIEAEYLKPGKVKYFFRDLPAPEHTNALAAAEAARCAAEQGKFWEMHDLLFAAQPAFSSSELASYAQVLGLDTAKFTECLASSKYEQAIGRVKMAARRMGIYGTPAFLIGTMSDDGNVMRASQLVTGGTQFEELKSVLDEVLAAAQPK